MHVIPGSITDIKSGVVCHQVNCMGAIGAGVSGVIIKKWPAVGKEYMHICQYTQNPEHLFGHWYLVRVDDKLSIYSIFSQFNYGNSAKTGQVYTDINLLSKALHDIASRSEIVYIPYGIGCGLAGGNWNELVQLIDDIDNLYAVRLRT